MKKRLGGAGGGQNRICMHKIQHICSHGNHSACHSLVKLHQGRWGPLSGSWWAWLPGTDQAPFSSLWTTSRSFTTLLFLFNSNSVRFSSLITRQMTTMVKKKKKEKNGIKQCSTEAWLLWFLWIGGRGTGLGRNSGPLLSEQHLKDFSTIVYRFGGRWRQCRASTSMTGCQD